MHVFIALWSLPISTILEKVYTHENESVKLSNQTVWLRRLCVVQTPTVLFLAFSFTVTHTTSKVLNFLLQIYTQLKRQTVIRLICSVLYLWGGRWACCCVQFSRLRRAGSVELRLTRSGLVSSCTLCCAYTLVCIEERQSQAEDF